jgi:hypothetical protein
MLRRYSIGTLVCLLFVGCASTASAVVHLVADSETSAEISADTYLAKMDAHVYTLAFATHDGKRRLLLVNKRNRSFHVAVAGAAGGNVDYVDQTTGFNPPGTARLRGESFELQGFSVAVVTLP